MIEATGCTECLVLTEVLDGDVWVGAGGVLDEVAEDGLVVVADDEDLADLRDFGYCGKAVLDDGVAGNFEERLGIM